MRGSVPVHSDIKRAPWGASAGRPPLNGCVRWDAKWNVYAVRTAEEWHASMSVLGNKAGERTDCGDDRTSSGRTACHSIPCDVVGKDRVSLLEQLRHGMRNEIPEGRDLVEVGTKMVQVPKCAAVVTVRPLHETPPNESIDLQGFGGLHN